MRNFEVFLYLGFFKIWLRYQQLDILNNSLGCRLILRYLDSRMQTCLIFWNLCLVFKFGFPYVFFKPSYICGSSLVRSFNHCHLLCLLRYEEIDFLSPTGLFCLLLNGWSIVDLSTQFVIMGILRWRALRPGIVFVHCCWLCGLVLIFCVSNCMIAYLEFICNYIHQELDFFNCSLQKCAQIFLKWAYGTMGQRLWMHWLIWLLLW
jgi:hypothetical protein